MQSDTGAMQPDTSQDAGLIRRGLLLLAGMCVLVAVVLSILLGRPRSTAPTDGVPPEVRALGLASPGNVYPASLSWGSLYNLGETMPSAPGWEIRYNAICALARLGSDRVPWPQFREILDEQRQLRNFRETPADGRDVADVGAAHLTVLTALKALSDWHHQQRQRQRTEAPDDVKTLIYPLVAALANSPVAELRVQAEKTRATFFP